MDRKRSRHVGVRAMKTPKKQRPHDEIGWICVDWPAVVSAVRKARTDDDAVRRIKRELGLEIRLQQFNAEQAAEKKWRRARIDATAADRVAAMAMTIASARDVHDWRRFEPIAKALDAAIRARRPFEV